MTPERKFWGSFFWIFTSDFRPPKTNFFQNTKSATLFFSLLFFSILAIANFTHDFDVFGVFEIPKVQY